MTQFLTQPINLQIKPNMRSKQVPYEYAPPKDSKSYTNQQNQEDITQNSFITDIKRSESAKTILKCKSTGKATVKEPMKLLENIIVCKKPNSQAYIQKTNKRQMGANLTSQTQNRTVNTKLNKIGCIRFTSTIFTTILKY
ncbi:Hypothetical_protein [Hexamita inflata]|uniref:Hypothetical_protein n=1 Tax=Hexamita inflata TaxID=28002 RepID=A0ABP1GVS3_9EUKA